MWVNVVIIGLLLFIVVNLAMGLVYMLRDRGRSDRTLKALTRRIAISVVLFLLLILGMATGIVTPHQNPLGLRPPGAESG